MNDSGQRDSDVSLARASDADTLPDSAGRGDIRPPLNARRGFIFGCAFALAIEVALAVAVVLALQHCP